MTSRPATPESDMPETDVHLKHLNLPDGSKVGIPIETTALLRSLERRLAQAQTRAAELEKALSDAAEALHNDFEPNNQSRAYHAARNALKDRA